MADCPVCDVGILTPITWGDVFRGVRVDGLEGNSCNHCGADPILMDQIKRNQDRIAKATARDTATEPK
jgi:hypothetical protein